MPLLTRPLSHSNWHAGFLAMMPDIARRASLAFRHLRTQRRADAVQDVVVSAMFAYLRLYRRGKADCAFPSVLAKFAIAQYHAGRRPSEKQNCRDVLSPTAARQKGLRIQSLSSFDADEQNWSDILVEDRHAGPAETAAARIDVNDWWETLNRRDQRIAKALSEGDQTRAVAKRFRVSPGRISQKRRELHDSWQMFQGDGVSAAGADLVPVCS